MTNAIATTESTALVVAEDRPLAWYRGQIDSLKEIIAKDCSDAELNLFAQVCRDQGLNPFSRQIYAIARTSQGQKKMTIQIAIDGLRLIAQRSGKYRGQTSPLFCKKADPDGSRSWDEVWEPDRENEFPYACKIGVHHSDFSDPLYVVARFSAYAATDYKNGKVTGLWAKMPDTMIAKVAEALALRKAFPQETMGLLTSEEMEQASNGERPPYDPKFSDLPAGQRADFERRIWTLAKQVLGAERLEERLFDFGAKAGLIDLDDRGKPDLLGTQFKKIEALIERLDAAARKKAATPPPEPEEIQDAEIVEEPKAEPKAKSKSAKAETNAETKAEEVSVMMEIERLEIELSGIQKPENRRHWYLQQVEEIEQTESRGDWLGPVSAKGPEWPQWTEEQYQAWLIWLRGQRG